MDDSTRTLIINIFLVLHFLGIAALLAGFFTSMKDMKTGMKVNVGVFHGAYLMLLTGLVMAGVTKPEDLNAIVIALKSISLTAIFFVAYTYRKKEVTPKWAVPTIFLLTTFNIVLAVFVGAAA
jgi:hypothetical protein